jgi:hypothetical protein
MNANELADKLNLFWHTENDKLFEDAATMLRQQQNEIEALKQILAYEGIGVSQEYLDECVADLRKAQEK